MGDNERHPHPNRWRVGTHIEMPYFFTDRDVGNTHRRKTFLYREQGAKSHNFTRKHLGKCLRDVESHKFTSLVTLSTETYPSNIFTHRCLELRSSGHVGIYLKSGIRRNKNIYAAALKTTPYN